MSQWLGEKTNEGAQRTAARTRVERADDTVVVHIERASTDAAIGQLRLTLAEAWTLAEALDAEGTRHAA